MKKYIISEQEINIILQGAEERIKSAEHALSGGFYRDSISRSYYAILDASRALLLKNNLILKEIHRRSRSSTVTSCGRSQFVLRYR
ncbi:MAG: HEPN domain-containing protein [Candidatus Kuenenbacteria bacterium]